MTLVLRIVVALVALVVAGWLAVGLRAAVFTERGNKALREGIAAQQAGAPAFRRAERNFARGGSLNPDRLPDSYRAQTLAALGSGSEARALAREVMREEPDDLEIWRTARAVALILQDRELEAETRRRQGELNPQAPVR